MLNELHEITHTHTRASIPKRNRHFIVIYSVLILYCWYIYDQLSLKKKQNTNKKKTFIRRNKNRSNRRVLLNCGVSWLQSDFTHFLLHSFFSSLICTEFLDERYFFVNRISVFFSQIPNSLFLNGCLFV